MGGTLLYPPLQTVYLEDTRLGPPLSHIPAAGVPSKLVGEGAKNCLHFDERPSTPDSEKKYRQSVLHEPGRIVRHFGLADDALHLGPFGEKTISRPGQTMADYIRSYPDSKTMQWRLERGEDVYAR